MTSFGWLHITDLHLGMNQQRGLLRAIEDNFFKDLERLHKKTAPWDLVIFTGDLTYKGSADEFEMLDEFLVKLWSHFQKLEENPSLVAVPGNHDLVRPDLHKNPHAWLLRNSWESDADIRNAFWDNPKSDFRETINAAFKNYKSWWDKTQLKVLSSFQSGELPGDFSVVLTKDNASLGIVGLNTAFLQLSGDDYKGKLAVHANQFQKVCDEDGPDWVKRHNACLLLTHQPPDWLSEDSERQFKSDISSYFDVHLFGHMHESRYGIDSGAGGPELRVFQATSFFGLEEFEPSKKNRVAEKPPENRRRHGYAAGRITLDGENGELTIWPLRANRAQDRWNFVVDVEAGFMVGEQIEPRRFVLRKPLPKPIGAAPVSVEAAASNTPEQLSSGKRWAIMVGVNGYKHFSPLQYCRQDAIDLAHAFREKLAFRQVLEFHEGAGPEFQPTRNCILQKLIDFHDSIQFRPEDLLVFYFSGHGINEGGSDYLLPIDARQRYVSTFGIHLEELVNVLKGFGCANTILFIDACREAVPGAKGTSAIGEDSSTIISDAGMVAFFSCNPKERSYEIDSLGHGSFTQCILNAINESTFSTVNDLNGYLMEEVPKINAKHNKPQQRPRSIIVSTHARKFEDCATCTWTRSEI
jgi:predicted MPP superfamily phosphohydrolase